jgi:hypothetical protein
LKYMNLILVPKMREMAIWEKEREWAKWPIQMVTTTKWCLC